MSDKISIIVPIYNVKKYIQQCVESLINQTYKNLEIILIDDGSTDGCGELCDEFGKKIKEFMLYINKMGACRTHEIKVSMSHLVII